MLSNKMWALGKITNFLPKVKHQISLSGVQELPSPFTIVHQEIPLATYKSDCYMYVAFGHLNVS